MINFYPLWKNVVIILVLIMGCIYLLPNFYKEDFAISITHRISDYQKIDNILLNDIKQTLINQKICNKSIFLNMNSIFIRFVSAEDQLHAYEILSRILSERYLIYLKKISSMPCWLFSIHAKPIRFGLDLQGGLYLVMRVDMMIVLNRLQDQYISILKSVLCEKTISDIEIYKIKNHGIGIIFKKLNDKEKSILYLSKMYSNLEFYSEDNYNLHIFFSNNYIYSVCQYAIQQNSTVLHHRLNQLKIIEPIVRCYGSDRIIIELPGVQDIARIREILSVEASLEFRLVNTEIDKFKIDNNIIPENSEIKLDYNGNIVPLYKKVILTGNHIIHSYVNFDEYNRPQINISLDNSGCAIISEFTKNNIGKTIATLFIEYKDSGRNDSRGYPILYKYDKVINIATIQSQLNHNFCIVGINNINEARYLSSILRMGSLVAPVHIEEERIISPTLGKINIVQGIMACGLGMLVSICFMILWYHRFGLIAALALIVNLLLILSIISLIPDVMLSIPSIAGIVLTLSVAIDANVLINERIKEEIRRGRPIQYSIYVGYRKAFVSIVDSNVTTIITSIVLYTMSTVSSIQSFAMITIIGVGTSMFTSILGTRMLVNFIYGRRNLSKLSI